MGSNNTLFIALDLSRCTEIYQCQIPFFRNHYIFRFDITMCNSKSVNFAQNLNQLVGYFACKRLFRRFHIYCFIEHESLDIVHNYIADLFRLFFVIDLCSSLGLKVMVDQDSINFFFIHFLHNLKFLC